MGSGGCRRVARLDSVRDTRGVGNGRPLMMLPILLLEIFYKVLRPAIVAYPLWSKGALAGSLAEGTTSAFLWVILPIVPCRGGMYS